MKKAEVLFVPFNIVTKKEVIKIILEKLKSPKLNSFFIATPNPEMILKSKDDEYFLNVLRNTDLNIADGTGILWASNYLNQIKKTNSKFIKIIITIKEIILIPLIPITNKRITKVLPERVTGTDIMDLVTKEIKSENKIFLLGGKGETATKTAEILLKNNSNKIVGTNNGSYKKEDEMNIIKQINDSKAELLFVAFGAPHQEIWIHRNLKHLKTVKVAIGVGGAFDFLCHNIKRAPKKMQSMGLEWLFRLIKQPSRIKRILNATIIFPIETITYAFQKNNNK